MFYFYFIVPKEEPVQIQIDEQAQLTIVSCLFLLIKFIFKKKCINVP